MCVGSAGRRPPLAPAVVRRAVAAVVAGERAGPVTVSVTFLSARRIRTLNRRTLGHDRPTDVIAFPLTHDGAPAGDIYICPEVAAAGARAWNVSAREELLRLVVHGTLHVLGHDHPPGERRTSSPMWRKQERYLKRLTRGAR